MSDNLLKSEKICRLDDLTNVPVMENDEAFVALSETNLQFTIADNDALALTDKDVFVRETVALQLEQVNASLGKEYSLDICHGYRSPEAQENEFRSILEHKVENEARRAAYWEPAKLRREWIDAAHSVVMAPEVAGHPTGGAVAVRLRDKYNRVVDMGTQIHNKASGLRRFTQSHHYDFTPPWQRQRLILREAMCEAGFAPYNNEWWSFSIGDKQAAVLKGDAAACYAQCQLDIHSREVRGYNPMSAYDVLAEVIDRRDLPQLKM